MPGWQRSRRYVADLESRLDHRRGDQHRASGAIPGDIMDWCAHSETRDDREKCTWKPRYRGEDFELSSGTIERVLFLFFVFFFFDHCQDRVR